MNDINDNNSSSFLNNTLDSLIRSKINNNVTKNSTLLSNNSNNISNSLEKSIRKIKNYNNKSLNIYNNSKTRSNKDLLPVKFSFNHKKLKRTSSRRSLRKQFDNWSMNNIMKIDENPINKLYFKLDNKDNNSFNNRSFKYSNEINSSDKYKVNIATVNPKNSLHSRKKGKTLLEISSELSSRIQTWRQKETQRLNLDQILKITNIKIKDLHLSDVKNHSNDFSNSNIISCSDNKISEGNKNEKDNVIGNKKNNENEKENSGNSLKMGKTKKKVHNSSDSKKQPNSQREIRKIKHSTKPVKSYSKSVVPTKQIGNILKGIKSFDSPKIIPLEEKKFRKLSRKKVLFDSMDEDETQDELENDEFIFNPQSTYFLIVDGLVLASTLLSQMLIPLDMGLINCFCHKFEWNLYDIYKICVDIIFFLDFLIYFNKAYYNFKMQLIKNHSNIIVHYFKGLFILNLLTAFPFNILGYFKCSDNPDFYCSNIYVSSFDFWCHFFTCLKLIKLPIIINKGKNRIMDEIYEFISVHYRIEAGVELVIYAITCVLIMHALTCMHIFLGSHIPLSWLDLNGLRDRSFVDKYITSIYFFLYTMTSVGYGDVKIRSFPETLFGIVILTVGVVAYTWIISSMGNFFKNKSYVSLKFTRDIATLKDIKFQYPTLPTKLYYKILNHLDHKNFHEKKKDKNLLIDNLPYTLKTNLIYSMYRHVINNFVFFKNFNNSDFITRILTKFISVKTKKNEILIKEGDAIDSIFFIKEGRLALEVTIDESDPAESCEYYLSDDYFPITLEDGKIFEDTVNGSMTSFADVKNVRRRLEKAINVGEEPASFQEKIENSQNLMRLDDVSEQKIIADGDVQYLKVVDYRKNEHFGGLLMYLNKRCPLTLTVKSNKAELYILRRRDAIEISSCYPHIWKRINKKSFHNMLQLRVVTRQIIKKFIASNGINVLADLNESHMLSVIDASKEEENINNQLHGESLLKKDNILENSDENSEDEMSNNSSSTNKIKGKKEREKEKNGKLKKNSDTNKGKVNPNCFTGIPNYNLNVQNLLNINGINNDNNKKIKLTIHPLMAGFGNGHALGSIGNLAMNYGNSIFRNNSINKLSALNQNFQTGQDFSTHLANAKRAGDVFGRRGSASMNSFMKPVFSQNILETSSSKRHSIVVTPTNSFSNSLYSGFLPRMSANLQRNSAMNGFGSGNNIFNINFYNQMNRQRKSALNIGAPGLKSMFKSKFSDNFQNHNRKNSLVSKVKNMLNPLIVPINRSNVDRENTYSRRPSQGYLIREKTLNSGEVNLASMVRSVYRNSIRLSNCGSSGLSIPSTLKRAKKYNSSKKLVKLRKPFNLFEKIPNKFMDSKRKSAEFSPAFDSNVDEIKKEINIKAEVGENVEKSQNNKEIKNKGNNEMGYYSNSENSHSLSETMSLGEANKNGPLTIENLPKGLANHLKIRLAENKSFISNSKTNENSSKENPDKYDDSENYVNNKIPTFSKMNSILNNLNNNRRISNFSSLSSNSNFNSCFENNRNKSGQGMNNLEVIKESNESHLLKFQSCESENMVKISIDNNQEINVQNDKSNERNIQKDKTYKLIETKVEGKERLNIDQELAKLGKKEEAKESQNKNKGNIKEEEKIGSFISNISKIELLELDNIFISDAVDKDDIGSLGVKKNSDNTSSKSKGFISRSHKKKITKKIKDLKSKLKKEDLDYKKMNTEMNMIAQINTALKTETKKSDNSTKVKVSNGEGSFSDELEKSMLNSSFDSMKDKNEIKVGEINKKTSIIGRKKLIKLSNSIKISKKEIEKGRCLSPVNRKFKGKKSKNKENIKKFNKQKTKTKSDKGFSTDCTSYSISEENSFEIPSSYANVNEYTNYEFIGNLEFQKRAKKFYLSYINGKSKKNLSKKGLISLTRKNTKNFNAQYTRRKSMRVNTFVRNQKNSKSEDSLISVQSHSIKKNEKYLLSPTNKKLRRRKTFLEAKNSDKEKEFKLDSSIEINNKNTVTLKNKKTKKQSTKKVKLLVSKSLAKSSHKNKINKMLSVKPPKVEHLNNTSKSKIFSSSEIGGQNFVLQKKKKEKFKRNSIIPAMLNKDKIDKDLIKKALFEKNDDEQNYELSNMVDNLNVGNDNDEDDFDSSDFDKDI